MAMDGRLRTILAVAFVVALAYDVWLGMGANQGLTTCPPLIGTADFSFTTYGFQFVVGEPLFSGQQLVLAPGTTASVVITISSVDNLSQYFQATGPAFFTASSNPFNAGSYVIDSSRTYRTSVGWNNDVISPNETGITIEETSFERVSDYKYIGVYDVSASRDARQGVYMMPMFFDGWCSPYYLTIGAFPYTGDLEAFPQTITWLLPFILVGLLGCVLLVVDRWIRKRLQPR